MTQPPTIDYQAIFEAAPASCLVLTPTLEIAAVSDSYLAATMTRREDILGRALFDVFPDNPADPDASGTRNLRASLDRVRLTRTLDTMPVQKYDIRRPDTKGGGFEERFWSAINAPVLDSDGQILYIVHRVEDVTECIHLQRRGTDQEKLTEALRGRVEKLEMEMYLRAKDVATRTAELARSNAELEQFAYAASHDLQEPLRMVASYVQLLARRYEGKLDADADDFIHFAVDGTKRMQTLIADLLRFSRVGTQGKAFAPTALDSVLGRVLANLQLEIENTGATVTRTPLPVVMADDTQMVQLLQNLISNALKFHGEAAPQIRVAGERREREHVISVRDNGIGIDPQYNDRIFVIFQRLHGRENYPGTGIGLALCKRVVERHHGRIWVESTPGHGATFYFTLPEMEGQAE